MSVVGILMCLAVGALVGWVGRDLWPDIVTQARALARRVRGR